jgi:hypothetical protein
MLGLLRGLLDLSAATCPAAHDTSGSDACWPNRGMSTANSGMPCAVSSARSVVSMVADRAGEAVKPDMDVGQDLSELVDELLTEWLER